MATYFKYVSSSMFTATGVLNGECLGNGLTTVDLPLTHQASVARTAGVLMQGVPKNNSAMFECYDYVSDPSMVVNPEWETIIDRKQKSTMSRESFLAQQAAGHVILQPMLVSNLKVKRLPAPPPDGLMTGLRTFTNQVASATVQGAQFTLAPGRMCNTDFPKGGYTHGWTTPGLACLDGELFSNGPARLMPGNRTYERWVVDRLVQPSPSDATAIAQFIESRLSNMEWHQGIITAAVAEANRGAWDVLTELAELRETVNWIMSLLREGVKTVLQFQRAARKVRRQPGKSAAIIADELSSLWMQFRYAFGPIGYSVDDATEYLLSSFKPYQTFRSGESREVNLDNPYGWDFSSLEAIDRVYLKYRFSSDFAFHNAGFNIAATAWQVTPLSFAVGWLLNIGDLLMSLQAPSNVLQQGAQYSRQVKGQTVTCKTVNGTVLINVGYYKSTPFNPLGQVGLHIESHMSWKRWLDALALSWNMTKSMLKKG